MTVLDASVAVKSYLEETGSDAAIALLTGEDRLAAPESIRLEVSAALCRRVRRGELAAEDAQARADHWNARLDEGLFMLVPDQPLLPDAVKLAIALKHPLQDCLYLASARRFEGPLITADRAFQVRAAPSYEKIQILAGCEKN